MHLTLVFIIYVQKLLYNLIQKKRSNLFSVFHKLIKFLLHFVRLEPVYPARQFLTVYLSI